jgi:D-apiose dehydrogenase
MADLRFAAFGAGFWARYQLAAWREVPGATCVAIYNRTRERAEALAAELGIPAVYDDAEALLREVRPDFVDIITDPSTHRHFAEVAARHGVPVVCQKPLAPTLDEAEAMARRCAEAGVPLIVHENWRWQRPIRELSAVLRSGVIGQMFRATITYCSSFPVFDNQPFLKDLDQFLLADVGVHILDAARFLFGEASRIYCQTERVHRDIRGEDVATIVMRMGGGISGASGGLTCACEISYASRLERERFPETYVLVEGDQGSVELAPDYWIRVTTAEGTHSRRCPPPVYPWADPAYSLIHSSIVACNEDVLRALSTRARAETDASDNLKTLRLVFAAYESAATGRAIEL